VRTHQLHLRLGLPAEGGSVADDLDRERLAVLASDLEDLAEGAAAEVAENLVALAVGRGDDVGHRHDQVALLIVRATEQQTGRKTARQAGGRAHARRSEPWGAMFAASCAAACRGPHSVRLVVVVAVWPQTWPWRILPTREESAGPKKPGGEEAGGCPGMQGIREAHFVSSACHSPVGDSL
jgi:hypothetical protein